MLYMLINILCSLRLIKSVTLRCGKKRCGKSVTLGGGARRPRSGDDGSSKITKMDYVTTASALVVCACFLILARS